jgi:glycosyltransferase involved in cell wall biosynthesis
MYFFIIISLSISYFGLFYDEYIIALTPFIKYIYDCKNMKKYNRETIINDHPYISICIAAKNMQDYIERNLLSILNQSFQNFEIIIVNDGSEDETENIINRVQLTDKRIKLLSHIKNYGVYRSRIEAITNSKSEYTLIMDPDDMYLNENLFQELYNYNKKYNLDIIEFSVMHQIEGNDNIFFPKLHIANHYHNFGKRIIFQPELSNILYYFPGTKQYSRTICRNIWNKMIRNKLLIQASNYIGKDFYNEYIITTDDMMLNVIVYQFAKNFSNINLPGYLYVRRKVSMSRGGDEDLIKTRAKNYVSYFILFYNYLHDYNKDINYLYYEMKDLHRFILAIKDNNMIQYIPIQKNFIQQALKEKNISNEFKEYLQNLLEYYKN